MKDDLKFLLQTIKRPRVGWHDPNFGVRFNETLDAIEEVVPHDSIDFIGESSLSLLNEAHLQRLQKVGFKAILPGVESWYDMGNKSKTGSKTGLEKVRRVSEHVNQILDYIPYVQTNFVLGLDCDEGSEPFELTKEFIRLTPGAFPGYSLLSAFGRASVLNLGYQRENRVLPFPFHFLDNNQAMNVIPKNYTWREFYGHLIDLTSTSFSWSEIGRRFKANRKAGPIPQWMNVVRAVSSEGFGRIKYHKEMLRRLDTDPQFEPFFTGKSRRVPDFYTGRVRSELGSLWEWLPEGAMEHDPNAYLKTTDAPLPKAVAEVVATP